MTFLITPSDWAAISLEARRRGWTLPALGGEAAASERSVGGSTPPAAPATLGPRHLAVLASRPELDEASAAGIMREALALSGGQDPILEVEARRFGIEAEAGCARALDAEMAALEGIEPEELVRLTSARLARLRQEGAADAVVAYVADGMARVWLRGGDMERARRLCGLAIKAEPGWVRARMTRAHVDAEEGRWRDAARGLPPALHGSLRGSALGLALRVNALAGERETARSLLSILVADRSVDDLRVLWDGLEAGLLLGLDTEGLRDRLARALGTDETPGRAPGLLDHLSQISAGRHRWLNDKALLQTMLRSRGLADLQPDAYLLPEERCGIEARLGSPEDRSARWVLKPAGLFGGKGIRLISSGDSAGREGTGPELGADRAVLQRYVEPPYLVDGHKAHVRIYLMILPEPRRRVWMSLDGIARLSPVAWDRAALTDDPAVHITNTNLHWGHPDLRVEQDPDSDDSGHVRRLGTVLDLMERASPDLQPRAVLKRFCTRLAAGVLPEIWPETAGLVALDLLFGADGRPWLLEIESRPQVAAGGVPVVGRLHDRFARDAWPILDAYLQRRDPPELSGIWAAIL